MSNLAVSVRYTIQFTSPFHIGAGYGLAGYLDATAVRRRDGNIYVPGASVKGRARWHLTGMLGQPWDHDLKPCPLASREDAICPVCNLFGIVGREPGLFFGDALLTYASDLAAQAAEAADPHERPDAHEAALLRQRAQVERRSQTSLSRRRGVAREELLFVTELGQAGLAFAGTVQGVLSNAGRTLPGIGIAGDEADSRRRGEEMNLVLLPADLGWLIAALSAITQLGGRKSRGLGHCTVTVTEVAAGRPGGGLTSLGEPARILQALRQEVKG